MARYPLEGAAREIMNDTGLSMNEYVIRWVVEHKPEQWVNGAFLENDIRASTGYDLRRAQIGQALHTTINNRKYDFDGTWMIERGSPAMYKWVPSTGNLVRAVTPAVRRPEPARPQLQPMYRVRVLDSRPDGSKLLVIDDDYYLATRIDS